MPEAILIVEDDDALREALCDTLELAGHRVCPAEDGRAALAALASEDIGLVVSDVQMSGMDGHALLKQIRQSHSDLPVVLMTAYGTIEKAVEAMREGARDYLVKPFEAETLLDIVRRFRRPDAGDGDPIAADARSRALLELAQRVAASPVTVLLSGESGTGKEVFARYIHAQSPRAKGPFIAINCAAIPENMLEAVLFGHEKGAFTGAHNASPGKFEQAQGGTLLLDEISEMDLGLQAKLLRVLQEREVERVGGRKVIKLDVRVLATTNRDLKAEVAEGRFREDLYYRLNVLPMRLPALRERRDDILPLTRQLLARHCAGRCPEPALSEDAVQALLANDWPGNVRELDNVIQRALILMRGDTLEPADLHFEDAAPVMTAAAETAPDAGENVLQSELKGREQRLIIEALREAGSRKAAAERLGISPRTLRYKIARLRESGVDVTEVIGAQIAC